MAASFPRVTVLIFLEVIFSGMYSVNFMQQSNFDLVFEVINWF